jgi:ATP-dependent protease HslVU (ClpYQ) peptidase subunit
MTCVVGLITDNGIMFGADSLVTTESGSKLTLSDKKVFLKNNILFGFCGDLRFGQLIKHRFNPPSPGRNKDIELFLHTKFLPDLQKFFIDAGYNKIEPGSFDLLIGIHKSIFVISDDFSVVETPNRYQSIGSGCDYALGVMYATKSIFNPTQRITLALEASSSFCQTVAKPFNFEFLQTVTKKPRVSKASKKQVKKVSKKTSKTTKRKK